MTNPSNRISPEKQAEVCSAYLGGMSMNAIVRATGVSMGSVHRYLKAHGVPSRSCDNTLATFWSRVTTSPSCWLWTGTVNRSGYGVFSIEDRRHLAHRFAWTLTHGEIPEGLLICHHCDVPGCCRPDHLFLGTYADNNRDSAAKGRSAAYRYPARYRAYMDIARRARIARLADERALAEEAGIATQKAMEV